MPSDEDDGLRGEAIDEPFGGPLDDAFEEDHADVELEPPAIWQRERLLNAMLDEVTSHGYAGTSIENVCARAGVAPETFAANFSSKEQCFLAAFDSLLHQLVAHTISAYHASSGAWPERLRAALSTCIAAIGMRSGAARTYLLEAALISPETRRHRAQAVAMFEETITEVLQDAPVVDKPSPITIAGVTGGIWRVIEARLRDDRAHELPGLVDGLLAWALTYVPGDDDDRHDPDPAPSTPAQPGLSGELTAGAITEIIERDGRESAGELAYLALAPVIGHERATATRRKVLTYR